MTNCIGKRINKLRLKAKEKQEDLAVYLNCNRASIANYENGKRTPDLDTIIKIAEHYNTTCDYLLGLSNTEVRNEDKTFISTYTGLSEKSMDLLHYYRDDEEYIKVVNALLESEGLELLNDIETSVSYEQYAVYLKIIEDMPQAEKLSIIHYIYSYIYTNALVKSGFISIKLSGKIDNSVQPTLFKNLFDSDTEVIVSHQELIEKLLLDKIVDSLKCLKKIIGGETNGNDTKA